MSTDQGPIPGDLVVREIPMPGKRGSAGWIAFVVAVRPALDGTSHRTLKAAVETAQVLAVQGGRGVRAWHELPGPNGGYEEIAT